LVEGDRLLPGDPGAVETAGDLLGRVHQVLVQASRRDWVPAALLEWSADFAAAIGNEEAAEVVAELAGYIEAGAVTQSVLYGDPAPEILVGQDGEVALIDWGTPSWGPLLHDVAAWLAWLGLEVDPDSPGATRFLAAYQARMPLASEELALLDRFGAYGIAFGL
jgi:homoserine kinase type II